MRTMRTFIGERSRHELNRRGFRLITAVMAIIVLLGLVGQDWSLPADRLLRIGTNGSSLSVLDHPGEDVRQVARRGDLR